MGVFESRPPYRAYFRGNINQRLLDLATMQIEGELRVVKTVKKEVRKPTKRVKMSSSYIMFF